MVVTNQTLVVQFRLNKKRVGLYWAIKMSDIEKYNFRPISLRSETCCLIKEPLNSINTIGIKPHNINNGMV